VQRVCPFGLGTEVSEKGTSPLVRRCTISVQNRKAHYRRSSHVGCGQVTECIVIGPLSLSPAVTEADGCFGGAVLVRPRRQLVTQSQVGDAIESEGRRSRVELERSTPVSREVLELVDLDERACGFVEEITWQ